MGGPRARTHGLARRGRGVGSARRGVRCRSRSRATRSVGVLLANAEEAWALTGLDRAEGALTLARRYRIVGVKLGRAGAIAAFEGTAVRAELRPLDRADTLGAGDAFAVGFLSR